ncbi:hypothetical protein E4U57_002007 [Claviceps arundinis]|uniref:Uncharacterized protein n=1 Tax=Claviceps arundinis TaxID=1623583 RepID=A0A9P7SUN3_9HYPO|nr:hypothetical protein E4U57_002007 [Claviceps arundinis]KAG5978677.1 hypothetical protein E4U56_000116 [Claviceps arundinis]
MAPHMYPGESKGPDYYLKNRSAGAERMSIQSILSCSESSEIRPICDGSQLSHHLPLPDLRDSVSASRPTNTNACVEHRHLDSALRPSHSATFPVPGAQKQQQAENKSPNRHVYQENEAVSEDVDNSKAEDEIEGGVSPGAQKRQHTENKSPNRHVYQGSEVASEDLDSSEADDESEEGVSSGTHEVAETSLSSVLAALDENWDEFLTSQLHAYHLPHVRARYRHQQRAAAMRYPVSLPLTWPWAPRTDQGG